MSESTAADIEAVKIVMARYFRFMDTKQWEALRGILADDMSMSAPDDVADSQPLIGADRVVRMVERVLGPALTTHRGYLRRSNSSAPTGARHLGHGRSRGIR